MKNRTLKEHVSQQIYNRLMELTDNGALDNDLTFVLATSFASFTHDTGYEINLTKLQLQYADFVDYLDMIGGKDDA